MQAHINLLDGNNDLNKSMNINLKKVIIFSLTILLNLSFFPVTSINATLKEDNLGLAREFQKRAALNNDGLIGQELDLSNKELGALKIKKLETRSEQLNLEKELQGNSVRTKLNYVSGEILVKYRSDKINLQTISGRDAASSFISSRSLEKKEDLRKSNISVLKIKDAKTVEQKIAELKNEPNVEYVEPNYIYPWSSISPNDSSFSLQWALNNIITTTADVSAPEAWDIATGSKAVIVGVLDSGVAYHHPDLINNMWDGSSGCKDESNQNISCPNHGWDFVTPDNDPNDDENHGTHVAGIIGAEGNNAEGVTGVNWNVKLMALKVGDYRGAIAGDVVKAIDFAINNNVKIINASFSGSSFSTPQYDAINRFKAAGGIFVTAAGNKSTNNESVHSYPSDYSLDNIISVAATDQNDALADFSNYGATSVDVGAPGVNIYSTVAGTNVFDEDFEGDAYKVTDGGITQSNWGIDNNGSSKVAYSDNYNYPYESSAYTWLMQKEALDLSGDNVSGANMSFTIWCDTPSSATFDDYIFTTYYSNGVWHDSTKYNEDKIYADGGSSWTDGGHLGYYKNYTENISNYLTNDFKFSFDWHTNSTIDYNWGCTIDDIKITKYFDGSNKEYDYKDGTSMAAPHVAGLAALIEGYNPSLTYSQVKNTILTTGDSLASLSGKTVSGKRINAQRALQAVNPAKAITAFSFVAPAVTGVIDETTHTIAVTVPFGTNVTALAPTIATSTGATVSPASGVAQDFTNPVIYTVTAANGSTQTYVVTVTVASATNHTISGTIKYYDGVKVIPNATVILENSIGTQIASTTTDVNGAYQFAGVTSGGDYVVRVIKTDNAFGLTSADQIKIGRHIVGLELFSIIYKNIAGDVNNSLGLTSADQIKIGRFIVGLDSNLPSGAWKFYSSNVVLTTANYLTVGLTRTFTNLIADMPSQDFVGIKMGDVNNSWVNN